MPGGFIVLVILYVLAMIVPVLPAVLIFKLFPDDKIKIKGQLSNFTINATGGFAAYFSTVLLGVYMINQLPSIMKEVETSAIDTKCTVKAKMIFRDENGNATSSPPYEKLSSMRLEYFPSQKNISQNEVRITLPEVSENSSLEIGLDGYKTVKMFVDNSKLDPRSKTIDMGEIVLEREPHYSAEGGIEAVSINIP